MTTSKCAGHRCSHRTTGTQRSGLSERTKYPRRQILIRRRRARNIRATLCLPTSVSSGWQWPSSWPISISTLILPGSRQTGNPAAAAPPVRAETPANARAQSVAGHLASQGGVDERAGRSSTRTPCRPAIRRCRAPTPDSRAASKAVQTPLLERLGPRPSRPPGVPSSREIPVKIFCACGFKNIPLKSVEGASVFQSPVGLQPDGTNQANQMYLRGCGITQPLPSPNAAGLLNPAPVIITRNGGCGQASVVKELAPARADHSNVTPIPVVKESGMKPQSRTCALKISSPACSPKGQSLADAGELDKAAKCFDTALALQPERAETLVKLAGVLRSRTGWTRRSSSTTAPSPLMNP